MSNDKPKKIRRRRTTGRVGGTTQSTFASNSMTSILQRKAKEQADRKGKPESESTDEAQDEAPEKRD